MVTLCINDLFQISINMEHKKELVDQGNENCKGNSLAIWIKCRKTNLLCKGNREYEALNMIKDNKRDLLSD